MKHDTWDLVWTPADSTVILFKWVFVQKSDAAPSGEPTVRYKVRVMGNGLLQVEVENFSETFCTSDQVHLDQNNPVDNGCVELSFAPGGVDVKTAYLDGKVEEKVYMEKPAGFIEQGKEKLVCRFRKALKRLRRAPR